MYICIKAKCKIDFNIKTKCNLTVQRLGFLGLNNRLAVGEGVLDPQAHHNFGNFIDTEINLKKVHSIQSIIYTVIKKNNELFLLAVANFPVNF